MTIDPTTGAALSASTTPRADTARATLGADYESFLKLLTAQVSNQDPLEPMDSTTFVSQLAQLSQVEQSIQTNAGLERIGAQLAAFGAVSEAGMIGRTVRAPGDTFTLADGGTVQLGFELSKDAEAVTATVVHPDGTALRQLENLPATSGTRHTVTWDGKDFQGLPLPAGEYRIRLNARDAAGDAVSYTSFTQGKVDSVVFKDGTPMLRLTSGEEVPSSLVVEIR
ncbi:flagellar hook assembly protein FlgD [Roseivivax isoporae]|uniref:Basal-body rod modification protein FlgD n=1 Tax=Roseivivax isoporae LMG 25204 TaxID=1449351 RepID=X7F9W1_9RHOB|nr:flagellar hook capping FlgD N-terminal domain-containing protein [Roseivivax isoporae]ETX28884.1 hypothetical protein RISW2_04015 [Roseivivax isoporae LMG 25204]